MGPSELTASQIGNYLCGPVNKCTPVNPSGTAGTWKPEINVYQMAQTYINEGNAVGVRGDIAFCQSIWETGWFGWPPPGSHWPEGPWAHADDGTWPGYVLALDHNYAGIGAFTGTNRYMRKPTPWQGVRAHLQHLRNYADPASHPWNLGNPFEPRPGYTTDNFTTFVYHGKAPRWIDLNGRWAVPGDNYAQSFLGICNNIRTFNGLPPVPTGASSSSSASSSGGVTSQDVVGGYERLRDETTYRN